MIRCKNGQEHTHHTVEESRRCWFPNLGVPASPVTAPPPPQVVTPAPIPVRMVSERQLDYVRRYNGDVTYAMKLTYGEAYSYVDSLIKKARANIPTKSVDPRLNMIASMLSIVPDGYYATAADGEGGHVDFLRFKHVTKASRQIPAGSLKIQTQHSDVWQNALIQWPQGNWSIYKRSAIEMVMLVIADYKTCARRYAIEVQACMRCNKQLTDDRSRHYLVGPECEVKHGFTWPIDAADEANGGLSFEQLVARGKPTRIWQDRLLDA